ncbi:hypothetical protein EGR_04606 [Echinococcus granulosus]|uniref:Uncharacterized protein n=1 Tax=Echinococcus granulosus TaxID=6210 RepID=W6UQJ4_ECHGR|nr:hypothetical protein EGR_04606 [Echinococcus granulosus]EUB60587.1 hypothetical protein EGR_04606 [Echinococcus granulosus]
MPKQSQNSLIYFFAVNDGGQPTADSGTAMQLERNQQCSYTRMGTCEPRFLALNTSTQLSDFKCGISKFTNTPPKSRILLITLSFCGKLCGQACSLLPANEGFHEATTLCRVSTSPVSTCWAPPSHSFLHVDFRHCSEFLATCDHKMNKSTYLVHYRVSAAIYQQSCFINYSQVELHKNNVPNQKNYIGLMVRTTRRGFQPPLRIYLEVGCLAKSTLIGHFISMGPVCLKLASLLICVSIPSHYRKS